MGVGRSNPAVSKGMNQKVGTTWMQDDIPNFVSSTAELRPSIPIFKAKFSQQIPHQDLALTNILEHIGIDFLGCNSSVTTLPEPRGIPTVPLAAGRILLATFGWVWDAPLQTWNPGGLSPSSLSPHSPHRNNGTSQHSNWEHLSDPR